MYVCVNERVIDVRLLESRLVCSLLSESLRIHFTSLYFAFALPEQQRINTGTKRDEGKYLQAQFL